MNFKHRKARETFVFVSRIVGETESICEMQESISPLMHRSMISRSTLNTSSLCDLHEINLRRGERPRACREGKCGFGVPVFNKKG